MLTSIFILIFSYFIAIILLVLVLWQGKNNCGRLGVVDAICDTADCLVEGACLVEDIDGVNTEEEEEEEQSDIGKERTRLAFPILAAQAVESEGGQSPSTFNYKVREMIEDAPQIESPICIGKVFDKPTSEEERSFSGSEVAVTCGGAHTVAFLKVQSKVPRNPLLHTCENAQFGCRAALTRRRMEIHRKKCIYARFTCPNSASGCDRSELRPDELQRHVATCRFRQVVCKCGVQLCLKDLKKHLDNVCLEVTEPCELCGEEISRRLLESHAENCRSNLKSDAPPVKIEAMAAAVAPEGPPKKNVSSSSPVADQLGGATAATLPKEVAKKVDSSRRRGAAPKRVGGGYAVPFEPTKSLPKVK